MRSGSSVARQSMNTASESQAVRLTNQIGLASISNLVKIPKQHRDRRPVPSGWLRVSAVVDASPRARIQTTTNTRVQTATNTCVEITTDTGVTTSTNTRVKTPADSGIRPSPDTGVRTAANARVPVARPSASIDPSHATEINCRVRQPAPIWRPRWQPRGNLDHCAASGSATGHQHYEFDLQKLGGRDRYRTCDRWCVNL